MKFQLNLSPVCGAADATAVRDDLGQWNSLKRVVKERERKRWK